MDAWCQDFWAISDTACSHLFDRTPHAWKKLAPWAKSKDEFVKRAAFALLASLSGASVARRLINRADKSKAEKIPKKPARKAAAG